MSKNVKKLFGERPDTVIVLSTPVAFDAEGLAEVEDEIAGVLIEIPGYEVEGWAEEAPQDDEPPAPEAPEEEEQEASEPDEEEEAEDTEEDASEDAEQKAPVRKAPARKTPGRR